MTSDDLAIEEGINRLAMNQKQFDLEHATAGDNAKRIPLRTYIGRAGRGFWKPCSSPSHLYSTALSFVPIAQWLPQYNVRECIVADLIGGITTGIMHVPAGLAYSALAGVDPVYGLYSSCFPAFFYMLFGTSKHCSIGSFAVVALMAGIANEHIMHQHGGSDIIEANGTLAAPPLTSIQIASTLTFAIGIVQFGAGLLRLEFLVSYFSDPLVSGFTTGSAVHVCLAQIDDIFGLTGLPKSSGPGYVYTRARDIIHAICDNRTNYTTLLASALSISFLYCGKEILSPYLKKKRFTVPVPYELILMILATAISAALDLQHAYDVPVVGFIPTGPPTPALPVMRILPDCMMQSLGMVVVSIAVHISLAKVYAKKLNYTVDSRQELYALGASSMLGGLFSVYPVSTALGRTSVSVSVGTKTQMSTLFSCTLLLVIIIWLGPLLQTLPMCILASVIIVALSGMFKRCDELAELWRVSRTDLLIWIVSFTATVVIDVMEGLTISILFALATVIFRSQWPKWESIFRATTIDGDDSALEDPSLHRPTICIFRFDAPLIFTNVERFVSKVKKSTDTWAKDSFGSFSKYFIIDCTSIAYIDYMGVKALSESVIDLKSRGIITLLAAVKPDVLIALRAQGMFNESFKDHIFPSLRDALSRTEGNC